MEFLAFWLGTSIVSFGMQMGNAFRMVKDVADAGYKINVEKISELIDKINPNATKMTLLSMIIPLFNMMISLKITMQYNDVRPMILDELNIMDGLEEMSELEKQEYQKSDIFECFSCAHKDGNETRRG